MDNFSKIFELLLMKQDRCYFADLSGLSSSLLLSPEFPPRGAGSRFVPGVYLAAGRQADNLATLQPYVR
jgi:hypothetical protein